ncbi:MAG: glycosyltransferase family 9 protein [Bdellovibrionaceae bacterium]|nr:glycosyltransferase family 9 protein [Pseudobdellovibrionaceae bacterium]
MKILVVSLLRIGDFFQQIPHLRALGENHEVHVLVNESLRPVTELFPEFRYHFFPRERLQTFLTSPNCNLLAAFEELRGLCEALRLESFQEIQNWTHNFLSTRLMDLLQAPVKTGAQFQDGELVRARGAETYLNDVWGPSRRPSFQWMDAVQMAVKSPRAGLLGADNHRHGPVYLQIFTSDEKKNWPQDRWLQLARDIRELGEDVRILCAPFELEKMLVDFYAFRVEVLDWRDLQQALSRAKLVISGDTSIVHLAALCRAPILGLYLGSADPYKTAPRQSGARVLWPEVACAPCRHSEMCGQRRHLCSESLNVQTVYNEVVAMMGHGTKSIKISNVRGFEVLPGISARPLLAEAGQGLEQIWAQLVWEFYLGRDHEQNVAPYGSAARLMTQKVVSTKSLRAWTETLNHKLEKTDEILEDLSFLIWNDLKTIGTQNDGMASDTQVRLLTESLRLLWPKTDFFHRLVDSMQVSDENRFLKLKNRKEALREATELVLIQKNLTRRMTQELSEREDNHGARA